MAWLLPCTSAMFLLTLIISLLIVSNACAQEQVTQEPVEDQEAVESKRSTHSQKLEQGRTRGEYRIFLPDNRWQIVSYVADDDGYRATVRYENGPHDIPRAEQSHWGFSTGTTTLFDNNESPPIYPIEPNPINTPRIPHRLNHHPLRSGDRFYEKPPYEPQLKHLVPNLPPYQDVLTSQGLNSFIVHPIPEEKPGDGRNRFEHHHQQHLFSGLEPKQNFQQKPPQLSKDVSPSSSSSPPRAYIRRPNPTTGEQQSPWPSEPPPIYTSSRPEKKYPDPPVYVPKKKAPQFVVKDSIIYDPNEYHPFFQPKEKPKILTVQPIRPFHLPDQFYENRFNQEQSVVTNLERPVRPTQHQDQQLPQQNQHRQPPPLPQKKEEERPQEQSNRPYLDTPVSNDWTPIYQPALPYQPERKPDTQESIPSYSLEPTEPYAPQQRLPFKASPAYPAEAIVEQQGPFYQPPAVYPATPAKTIKPQQISSLELAPSYIDTAIKPDSSYPEKPVELHETEEKPTVKPLPSSSDKLIETYETEKKPGYEAIPFYPEKPVQPYRPNQFSGYEIDTSYLDKPDLTYDFEPKLEYEPTVPYDEKQYEPITVYPGKPYEPEGVYPNKSYNPYELQLVYERPEKAEYEPARPYGDKRNESVTAYPDEPYELQTEPAMAYGDKQNEAVAPYPDRATETYEPEMKSKYESVPSYPDYPVQQFVPAPGEEYRTQYETDRPYVHQQREDIRHPYRQYPPIQLQSIGPVSNRPSGNYRQSSYRRPYGVPHTGYSPGTSNSGIASIRPILNPKNQSLLTVDLDDSLEGIAPTEALKFELEELEITSTKKPEAPRKAYQPKSRKPLRNSPVRSKITRPFSNRVPVKFPVQETTEKLPNEQYSPLLAKYRFKGSTTSNDGYGQRTQPRRKQSKQSTAGIKILSSIEEDSLDESIRSVYSNQRVENNNSYLVTGISDEDQISELDSFLPVEEEFYSSNTSNSDVLYFDDGMIPPLLLRVRDKIPSTKIESDISLLYAVTELVTDFPTTTAIPTEMPAVAAPTTEIPSTTIASTTTTSITKTTTSTAKPSTKAGKRKKKKRVRTKALKRGNGTETIMPASKKVQTVSVIVKDVLPPVSPKPRISPRIRFPPRVRFVQKTAERVTRQNEKDDDLVGSHSLNEVVLSRGFQENDMIENHAMTKEDLMEWSLNAIPVERLDLVYDSVELEDKLVK